MSDDVVIEKTPAEIAAEKVKTDRESIKVTSVVNDKDQPVVTTDEDDPKIIEDDKVIVEQTAEEIEAAKIKEAEDKETEKEAKKQERIERKFAKEAAEKKALKDEVEALKKKLEAKPDAENVLTADDITKEAKRIAEQEIMQRDFDAAQARLIKSAVKADKDFMKKIKSVADEIAPMPGQMIGILDDLDNSGVVLSHLANDPDEYERIITLPIVKMAIELSKISAKLDKKPEREISKVPDPGKLVGGNRGTPSNKPNIKTDSTEEWIRKRNIQVAERNAMKRNGMRV